MGIASFSIAMFGAVLLLLIPAHRSWSLLAHRPTLARHRRRSDAGLSRGSSSGMPFLQVVEPVDHSGRELGRACAPPARASFTIWSVLRCWATFFAVGESRGCLARTTAFSCSTGTATWHSATKPFRCPYGPITSALAGRGRRIAPRSPEPARHRASRRILLATTTPTWHPSTAEPVRVG